MKKSLTFLQFAGFVFTGIMGTLLHFLYEWTGENIIAGLLSAVNESIWEHMKLLYFPMLIFALLENKLLRGKYENFWCAKLFGLLLGLIAIPIIYYTYTGVLGISADWFNILIFFIAAAISFYLETKIIKGGRECIFSPTAAKIIILLIGLVFLIFTFVPPHIPLFKDPISSSYGINKLI